MKIKFWINNTWMLTLILLTSVHAVTAPKVQSSSALDLPAVKSLYKQRHFQQVVENGQNYLKKYPKDVDVQLFVALSYYQLKNYSAAEDNFKSILKNYPSYKDASIGLIRTNMAQKKYDDALRVIQSSEAHHPKDHELQDAKNKIKLLKNENRGTSKSKSNPGTSKSKSNQGMDKPQSNQGIGKPQSNRGIVKSEFNNPKQAESKSGDTRFVSTGKAAASDFSTVEPYWELTALSLNANVDDSNVNNTSHIWDWSSAYLYRKNQYGAFGGAVNYANRFGLGAYQFLLNAQPKITNKMWLDLGYATANNHTNPSNTVLFPNTTNISNRAILFPNDTAFGEAYGMINKNIELSLGAIYKRIEHNRFNTYTGSIGAYLSNYYVSFRPNHYVPNSGPNSTLYTVKVRRYGVNCPAQFIGIAVSSGTAPDLFDLQSVDFIQVDDNIFFLEGQQPLTNSFAFIYGAGYERQKFPNALVRRLAYVNVGLKLAFA